jgi:hypothetical protein
MPAVSFLIATFTSPERISTNPQFFLWLLPLVAAIAVVYKATKVSKIKIDSFLKEAAVLFGSIIIFMVITAIVLCALAWLIIE